MKWIIEVAVPLCAQVDNKMLAMRSMPMHILIHAPSQDSAWGIGHETPAQFSNIRRAVPEKIKIFDN